MAGLKIESIENISFYLCSVGKSWPSSFSPLSSKECKIKIDLIPVIKFLDKTSG